MYANNQENPQLHITTMHFKPTHTYRPLWEIRAWYVNLWPVERWMFNLFVIVPIIASMLAITFHMPKMPDIHGKTQALELVSSDAYEDYTPDTVELANLVRDTKVITPPKKYENYLASTKSQTNRHRRLKKKQNKYTHKKDTKNVKQSGPTN